MKSLSAFINTLKALGIDKALLKNVMRWVAPHWVSPVAAGRLAATAEEFWTNKTGGLVTINGKNVVKYTAKMFVFKVYPFKFECQIAQVEIGAHKTDAEYYKSAICKWLRKHDLEKPYDERVEYPDDDNDLIDLLNSSPQFLFAPIKAPDQQTIQTLRTTFETVVFLLWTGVDLESIACTPPVVRLEPPVDSTRENNEYADWRTAMSALGA